MNVLDRTIDQIIKAGFSHVKVELEANLHRSGHDRPQCDDCRGDGNVECTNCEGAGVISIDDALANPHSIECAVCSGEEYVTCTTCDGSGESANSYNFYEEDDCKRFIYDQLSPEARKAITFAKFYNDGSVDSELTATMPTEKMAHLVELVEAFSALAEANGRGMETEGAGMHLTVLPHQNKGVYPGRYVMPRDKTDNFTREVTKLLPALFFAASCDEKSRGFRYRPTSIGTGKYNAVSTHSGTCYEFRVFETCYQRPEAIFEYFETIAKLLQYHKTPTKKVPTLGKKYNFVEGSGVARFIDTPEKYEILRKQIALVKPTGKTFKAMCVDRKVDSTSSAMIRKYKKRSAELTALYVEYEKNTKTRLELTEKRYSKTELAEYMRLNGYTKERALVRLANVVLVTQEQFINTNLNNAGQVSTSLSV